MAIGSVVQQHLQPPMPAPVASQAMQWEQMMGVLKNVADCIASLKDLPERVAEAVAQKSSSMPATVPTTPRSSSASSIFSTPGSRSIASSPSGSGTSVPHVEGFGFYDTDMKKPCLYTDVRHSHCCTQFWVSRRKLTLVNVGSRKQSFVCLFVCFPTVCLLFDWPAWSVGVRCRRCDLRHRCARSLQDSWHRRANGS